MRCTPPPPAITLLEPRLLLADLSGAYAWQPIRIGGGGWADGIIISESDPNVRFVRDDTGQAYRWDAMRSEWMPLGVKNADGSGLPTSAVPTPSHALRVDPRSFALDPNNNSILYLYARVGDQWTLGSNAWNVYKSLDGGRNFLATNFNAAAGFTNNDSDDPGILNFRYEGERLSVDPNNSNVIYLGTGTKGLFKSVNGGIDWTAMNGGGLPTGVDMMNILPYEKGATITVGGVTVSRTVYLITAAGNVYRSTDGGQNWSNITAGVGPTGKCQAATLDQNNGVLYVPTSDGNLWRYSGSWSRIKTGGASSVTVDPNNSSRLFVVASGGGQVARSLNGGTSWTNLSFEYAGRMGFSGSPHPTWRSVSKILMDSAGYVWQVEGNDAVLKWQSNDSATLASWSPDVNGIENFVAMDISLPNGHGGTKAYVSVQDEGGLVVNNLDTHDITLVSPQPNLAVGTTVAVCPNDPDTFATVIYDGYGGTGTYSAISTDGGATYSTFRSMGTVPANLQMANLAISRRGNWAAGSDHLVWLGNVPYYSKDGGRTWTASSTSFGTIAIQNSAYRVDRELVADPFVPDKYYVSFQNGGFWVTTDGGVTWTKRSSPRGAGYLSANHAVQDDLWLSSDQLYHSTDGGWTWSPVNTNGGSWSSIGLGAGSGKAGDAPYTIYLLYYSSRWLPATDYGVFRSTNAGASWDRIAYWPAGLMIDGNGEITQGMVAASWDTFGTVAISAAGQGFIYGKLLTSATPTAVNLASVSDTGVSNTDGLTRLNSALQFTVTGTIPGASVSLFDGQTLIGSATASSGTTIVTSTGTLPDGTHNITARQTENGKLLSAPSPADSITIDTVAPRVTSTSVNDGAIQRSMVKTLSATFGEVVSVTTTAMTASFTRGGLPAAVSFTRTDRGDGKTWDLKFSGTGAIGESLPDGLYQLNLAPAGVADLAGNALTGYSPMRFHRLFGDVDGDRDVDKVDQQQFRRALNRPANYRSEFDYNGDLVIDLLESREFQLRMTRKIL